MLPVSTLCVSTSEKGVPHWIGANPLGSQLDLKPVVDFCAQPKIAAMNDKVTLRL
jgi:hypothetical protein